MQSPRWTPRQKRLGALSRVLGRKQYSHIGVPFSKEREGNEGTGKRILLDKRRPSVQDPLAVELVSDLVTKIFGEGRRPLVLGADDNTTEWIAAFIVDSNFWITMMDALWKGSVGSSLVVLRVLGKTRETEELDEEDRPIVEPDGPGRYFFEVWAAEECNPIFNRQAPDELVKVDRVYFVSEDHLRAQGYDVEALNTRWSRQGSAWMKASKQMQKNAGGLVIQDWAMRITLTANEEVWYQPVPRFVYERNDWKESNWEKSDRSFVHNIGEVPAQWIRPLPLNSDDYYPDGVCLFEPVIDYQFRIDRTLSQTGRAFDYSGDPQMARLRAAGDTVPSGAFGMPLSMGGTASDVIESTPGGDAKFVEITGEGLAVAIDTYISKLEDLARKAGKMSRMSPDSKTGANPDMSAAALEMLNEELLSLCGILRATAAEQPGTKLMRLAMRLWTMVDVALPSLESEVKPNPECALEWQWPKYYEPRGQEKLFEIQAAVAAVEGRFISQETGVANIGPFYDVQDTDQEMQLIEDDQEKALANEVLRTKALAAVAPQTGPNGVPKK